MSGKKYLTDEERKARAEKTKADYAACADKYKGLTFAGLMLCKRKEKGWTMKEAAEEFGIGAPYLSDIEKGKQKPPSTRTIKQIAVALHLREGETKYLLDTADAEHNGISKEKVAFIREHSELSLFITMLMGIEDDYGGEYIDGWDELSQKYIRKFCLSAVRSIEDFYEKEMPQLLGLSADTQDDGNE
jgi:transcriptional regulator with XRE-family HTH domain